tara:strand:+ start:4899 stop:5750 length:852 start_codon:yes stop_codon:yes gene_type:complete
VTLKQLIEESPIRWPTIWDEKDKRITCLVLLPRKSRPEMEQHGFFIEHKHPVFGLFYRPRDEARILTSRGFDPLSASFQFLNISESDLELWTSELIKKQNYEKSSITIEPIPSSAISSIRLSFEAFEMLTFRHNSLDYLDTLPLVMPPQSLVSKAYISIPDITSVTPELEIKPEELDKNESSPIIETPSIENIMEDDVIVEIESIEEKELTDSKNIVPKAIVEEQVSLPGVGVESEFRMIVQKLIAEGLDHQAIMENNEFQDISDRATAAGVNTWELFLKLAT